MLSILIPVYNYNIVDLVNELQRQCLKASIPFEIVVLDDCSSELLRDQNKDVGNLQGVRFIELDRNIGRARIRNRLAEMASYSSLIFMDCDSEVPDDQYINRYLPYCEKELVVCGGRIYRNDQPDEPENTLRWLYGTYREQIPAAKRNLNPYRSFMTNNFLIPASVMKRIHFDESIIHYGHEDTLFGLELKKRNIPIVHIENPLLHTGLEIAREFLRKTTEGIENLITLVQNGKIDKKDFKDIRILRTYEILRKYHLVGIYMFFYDFISNTVTRRLLGANPGLFTFDLFKLSLLCHMIRNHKLDQSFYQS
jgi:GT2 family glycosyltransferase